MSILNFFKEFFDKSNTKGQKYSNEQFQDLKARISRLIKLQNEVIGGLAAVKDPDVYRLLDSKQQGNIDEIIEKFQLYLTTCKRRLAEL